jgi:hypothetical protein
VNFSREFPRGILRTFLPATRSQSCVQKAKIRGITPERPRKTAKQKILIFYGGLISGYLNIKRKIKVEQGENQYGYHIRRVAV